jgi:hypothetical protein
MIGIIAREPRDSYHFFLTKDGEPTSKADWHRKRGMIVHRSSLKIKDLSDIVF